MVRVWFAVVLAFAAGCGKIPGTGGKQDGSDGFPSASWTHKELAEHLARKNVKVDVESIPQYSTNDKVAAGFYASDTPERPMVLVYVCKDNPTARDQAGAMGNDAFASGRFAIGLHPKRNGEQGDRPLLRRVAEALK